MEAMNTNVNTKYYQLAVFYLCIVAVFAALTPTTVSKLVPLLPDPCKPAHSFVFCYICDVTVVDAHIKQIMRSEYVGLVPVSQKAHTSDCFKSSDSCFFSYSWLCIMSVRGDISNMVT